MKKSTPLKASGVAMALAAAGMLAGCQSQSKVSSISASGSTATTAAKATKVDLAHCYGVNVCKGHNDCKSATNACKGQASCKGLGFVAIPSKACGDVGGDVKDEWRGSIAKADLSKCYGVNICAGHNDCKTATNACGGQASCKGTGFVTMQSKACTDIDGKLS